MDLTRLRDVWAHREFQRLLAVRSVGQFGDGLLQAALAAFVLFSPERAPTAGRVAASFAILLLPYSLVGPFLGILIDRWQRRSILISGNLIRAIVALLVAVVITTGKAGWPLATSVLVALGLSRFMLTTLSAALAHTVAVSTLVTANAVAPTVGTMAATVGALLGVGVRQTVGGDHGSAAVVCIGVGCYLVAAIISRGFAPSLLGPTGPGQTLRDVLRSMGDGWAHLMRRPAAAASIFVVAFHRAGFGALTALAVIILRTEVYRPGQTGPALTAIAIVTGAAALGALLAAVATPAAVRGVGIPRWIATSLIAAAIATPLGIPRASLVGLLGTALVVGFAGQAVKVSADTVVQQQIDDRHRGRVFAYYDMTVNVALVFGVACVAWSTHPGPVPTALAWVLGAWFVLGAMVGTQVRAAQPD